ncbi:MAG: nucleotidyltransferase family protein [Synergistaceae bacterium]|nr:nucleotidyltransferase family protein [Synergistaceae bacterium]
MCALKNSEKFSAVTGIIAEFNPLHKGHEILIRSQKKFGACVVVLSSNFTQRGSPAFIDKFLRAEMAIKAGADLVVELPFIFACSAAQDFSRGAVGILARMKFITHIAFGMEDPEFNFLPLLIEINSSENYKKFLHEELKRGASFSKAHSIATEKILPGSHEFLSKPNNLLGVSYISELRRNNFDIAPFFIKREGIFKSRDIRENLEENFYMLPDFSREILLYAKKNGRICEEKNLWPLLQNIFIRTSSEDLRKIYGIDEGIENLFLKNWRGSKNLDDFIGRCVCARYTRSHIRRRLIYILLGLNKFEALGALRNTAPYARVLAFNQTGRELLKTFSKNSDIKFITRLKDSKSRTEKFFAGLELKASQLYEILLKNPDMNRELHKVLQF